MNESGERWRYELEMKWHFNVPNNFQMIVYDVADAGDAQNHFPKCVLK